MRAEFLRMISRNSRVGRGIFGSSVEQGFGISLNRSQRRAEFVGNVGDKIAARFFHALGFGEIAEHGDGAAIGQGSGGHIEGAAGNNGGGAGGLDFAVVVVAALTAARKSGSRMVSTTGCVAGEYAAEPGDPWADWPTAPGHRS